MDTREPERPNIPAELLGQTDQLRLNFAGSPAPDPSLGPDSTLTSVHELDLRDRRGRRYLLTVHQDRLSRCVLAYRLHRHGGD
jgi:transposase InsO family protein